MKKIDLNVNFKTLSGEDATDESGANLKLSKTLANFIANGSTAEPAKFMGWALKLMDTGVIEVDDIDKEKIIKFIDGHKQMTNILKYQLTEAVG